MRERERGEGSGSSPRHCPHPRYRGTDAAAGQRRGMVASRPPAAPRRVPNTASRSPRPASAVRGGFADAAAGRTYRQATGAAALSS